MSDPFYTGGQLLGGLSGAEIVMNTPSQRAAHDVNAYRNNVAPAGLAIADRRDRTPIAVLGQDGQELTLERRQQIMNAIREGADEEQLDELCTAEKLGESAQKHLPGTRFVQPRELASPDLSQFMCDGRYEQSEHAHAVLTAQSAEELPQLLTRALRMLSKVERSAHVTHVVVGPLLRSAVDRSRPAFAQWQVLQPADWASSQTVRLCCDPEVSYLFVDINICS